MPNHDQHLPTGEQITISHGEYSATIASVGASLRELTFAGRDLVVPFAATRIRPVFRGAILAPWPNRIVDGVYTFDGVEYQLPLTEPSRGHALHGLLAWTRWAVEQAADSSVTLATEVVPSDGYPFPLDVRVTYALDDDGLTTTVAAVNRGVVDAPYGTAPHPYLTAGPGHVDDWTLTLPAADFLDVTEDRLIPTGVGSVESRVEFDFRSPRVLGSLFIDHAFTGLARDDEGQTEVRVTAPGGTGVRMTWGTELPWVQIHTADRPEEALNRLGLAVEPMTCPPDAFSTGTDVVRLAPGASHTVSWTIATL
ncbi:MAG: galactose mutarotase [Frondihabitans sp.]|nr:galactose mutarotase [Frondihabitans sp.]